MPILIMEVLLRTRFRLLGIFKPTSIIDIRLPFEFSRKLLRNMLRLFLLMLAMTFGLNSFPNTDLRFFWLNHPRF